MTYKETLEYLFNQLPMFERQGKSGYKSGLDNTLALDEHLGHPHTAYRTIHVAGTNGKGSCSHTLAAMLQVCGYRVGLYTSPHLVDFRERIRINGATIPESYVVNFVEKHRTFFEPLHPSFFELTTAMAFQYFAEMKVDIAVIEVGLGGRLDCTNIISPILTVITNISYDHTQFLGDTLAKIAGEKAGTIKPGTPVVIGESNDETRPVFEAKAREMNAPIIFAEDKENAEVTDAIQIEDRTADTPDTLLYKTRSYGAIKGCLTGIYQRKNANTILVARKELVKLGYLSDGSDPKTEEACRHELAEAFVHVDKLTGIMGRWQTVKEVPRVVCDTGHNLAGWKYLSRQLADVNCLHMHIVFGMVDDKDIDGVIRLLPKNATYYFTQADTHRALPCHVVREKAEAIGLKGRDYATVKDAYTDALRHAAHDDFIFVGGSSYVVADFLKHCL